ncbi:class I SAM-dependent methyltransferase [Candidatus Bathyarchaeota archaeon]|nr:class I SAM-dependent methyltransferase [Candidatus Bathyarchaeota archaeon]
MSKFNLVTIRPKGFLHSSAFHEVKESLGWALSALGHETMATENAFSASPDSTNVIFGAELLSPTAELPPNSILYNLEQPSHPSMKNVERLAKGKTVWDYSETNVESWKSLGITAKHLPIGYTPNLTRIPKAQTQDIDVFFAGWMTPRRSKLIQSLANAGIKVVATDSCYGGGRDNLISRSKLCLNVNHDGRSLFNIVRVSFLLANAKCVVSETCSDQDHYRQLGDEAIAWTDYEHLVDVCQLYLRSDAAREEREQQGFQAIKRMDYIEYVREVLSDSPCSNPVLCRYERGCREGDMKDFLPTLRSLAKGNVLEIGVRDGASTSALLLGLEENGGHLTSVDITDCGNLWSHPQWTFVQADSKEKSFNDNHLDMAFIDGDHTAEGFRTDLENCLRWVKPGGIILVHDISPIPNYTQEARGGDWPSQYVGEEFFRAVKEKKLRYLIYPGQWGMGMIVKDSQ